MIQTSDETERVLPITYPLTRSPRFAPSTPPLSFCSSKKKCWSPR